MRIFALVVFLLFTVVPASAAQRLALVIGNGAYDKATKLPNAASDAEAIAKMFTDMDFIVSLGTDLNEDGMRKIVDEFAAAAKGAELLAVYYAGHGTMASGEDFLLPTDIDPAQELAALAHAMPLGDVLRALEPSGAKMIAFIDTNRTSAFKGARETGSAGYRPGPQQPGMLLSFSTNVGEIALDGDGKNSPYTAALLKHLPEPGQDVQSALTQVKVDVYKATKGQQAPFDASTLSAPLVLKK